MKKTLIDLLKAFLVLISMLMGFFFIYALVLVAFDVAITIWISILLTCVSFSSVFVLLKWVGSE